jgi:predicted kinase
VTAATHATLIRIHILPVIGTLKLRDLKRLHIEAVKEKVVARRSQKSALNVFRRLDAVLKQAVRWQRFPAIPATRCRRRDHAASYLTCLRQKNFRSLLEVADRTPTARLPGWQYSPAHGRASS